MKLVWRGDEIKREMRAAAVVGIDETIGACVEHSKEGHPEYPPASDPFTPWANRSHDLTESVRVFDSAQPSGPSTITGSWGSHVHYSLFIEIGTSDEGPTATARMEAADGNPDLITPEIGPLMARRHRMVPVSDREYEDLAPRIAAAFNAT